MRKIENQRDSTALEATHWSLKQTRIHTEVHWMEPLLYGAKDMKSNGRTLAAPEWKGVTGVALVTSQHQPASGSGWDIPSFKPDSEF